MLHGELQFPKNILVDILHRILKRRTCTEMELNPRIPAFPWVTTIYSFKQNRDSPKDYLR